MKSKTEKELDSFLFVLKSFQIKVKTNRERLGNTFL